MTTRLRVLLVALLAGLAVLAPAGTASAHDALRTSNPKDGAEIARAPAEITLSYTATVLKLGSVVRVLDPDGENVAVGDPGFTDREVKQPLQPGLAAGRYRVEWQVTSSDGHPIAGKFAFTVTEGAAPPATTPAAPAATPQQAPTTAGPTAVSPVTDEDDGSSWGSPAVFGLIAVVIVAVVVGAAVLARRRTS